MTSLWATPAWYGGRADAHESPVLWLYMGAAAGLALMGKAIEALWRWKDGGRR